MNLKRINLSSLPVIYSLGCVSLTKFCFRFVFCGVMISVSLFKCFVQIDDAVCDVYVLFRFYIQIIIMDLSHVSFKLCLLISCESPTCSVVVSSKVVKVYSVLTNKINWRCICIDSELLVDHDYTVQNLQNHNIS